MSSVTAIVIGYNHQEHLGPCLDSLQQQQGLEQLEIIYVDNASTDQSLAEARSRPPVRVIQNPRNEGFARAVNQALALAHHRYIALINPDVRLAKNTLLKLIAALQALPWPAVVGPVLEGVGGHVQTSLAPYPTLTGMVEKHLRVLQPPKAVATRMRTRPREKKWLIGALIMIERDLLQFIGGLDERYFVYGEDMELSFCIHHLNGIVHLEPAVRIFHQGNAFWPADRILRVFGGYMRFAKLHFPGQRLPLGLALSLYWILKGARARRGPRHIISDLGRMWSIARDVPGEDLP